nr:hypothetical protein [Pantoea cypripedii]
MNHSYQLVVQQMQLQQDYVVVIVDLLNLQIMGDRLFSISVTLPRDKDDSIFELEKIAIQKAALTLHQISEDLLSAA